MESQSEVGRVVVFLLTASLLCATASGYFVYSGKFDFPIPAEPGSTQGWMIDATIYVPDSFTISDLDVGINLTHENVFDLMLFLESPTGTSLCLNTYGLAEFFVGANYRYTIFDDQALIPIEEGKAPFTGRFKPKAGNLLETFDGENAGGLWRLRVYDAFKGDSGTLHDFKLMITSPEPSTLMMLMLGARLMLLGKRRGRN